MLKQEIQTAISASVKSGDQLSSSTLRMLSASITGKEKEKRYKVSKQNPGLSEAELIEKSVLTDEEIIEIVSSEVKKRKEAILSFNSGNRPELAEKEKAEMDILMKYLPEQLSAEELKKIVVDAISSTGAKEMKDMGKVMAIVMPKVKGKADGSEVSKVAKEVMGL